NVPLTHGDSLLRRSPISMGFVDYLVKRGERPEGGPFRLGDQGAESFIVGSVEIFFRGPASYVDEAILGIGSQGAVQFVLQVALFLLHVGVDLLPQREEFILASGRNFETVDQSNHGSPFPGLL